MTENEKKLIAVIKSYELAVTALRGVDAIVAMLIAQAFAMGKEVVTEIESAGQSGN